MLSVDDSEMNRSKNCPSKAQEEQKKHNIAFTKKR